MSERNVCPEWCVSCRVADGGGHRSRVRQVGSHRTGYVSATLLQAPDEEPRIIMMVSRFGLGQTALLPPAEAEALADDLSALLLAAHPRRPGA